MDIKRTTLNFTETESVSVCGLANEYIFNTRVCDRFSFTVTPTEGEMRGTTSEPVTGLFQTTRGVGVGALCTH